VYSIVTEGVWYRFSDDRVIEASDITIPPAGYNALDAFRGGWVRVSFRRHPEIEGTPAALRLAGPRLAGLIQERYAVYPEEAEIGFGERMYFPVGVRLFDDRGRPLDQYTASLEEVILGFPSALQPIAARRPRGVPCGCHQVHVKPYRRSV
jgi:hypothetical protein